MPINTSFAGNIPWLITEPPSVALARGLEAGQGIAQQRLAQQRINLQAQENASQLQFQQARETALEGHRQVEEGLQQAQEARQKALFARTASNDLSRRIGMGIFTDDLETWHADHPDATPAQAAQAQTDFMLKHADKLFPDGQGFPQALHGAVQAVGTLGVQDAMNKAREASAGLSQERTKALQLKETQDWLGDGTIAKPTARAQDARDYEAAKVALGEADSVRQKESTPKSEADYQKALTHFNSLERFAPQGGSESSRAAKVSDQAFRATHQELLTKLRNLYAQSQFAGKAQKPELDKKIEEVDKQLKDLVSAYVGNQATATPATVPATTPVPRVKIKDSNGKEFTIPAAQLKQALDEGYTESK
jgi:hypothetical protein